ncbi:MAG TPA: hypothetical protein VFS52_16635 [Steroidobacteraceae bacterium]|nr:hypothetical protein [Steroidobacteraceae bacterium]
MRRAVLSTLVLLAASAAAHAGNTKCTMTFKMSGWSAFYKTANGTGHIKCSNGQSMNVKLRARGGGLTVGKSTIEDGRGEFTGISGGIEELLGSYVAAEAHAGAVNSAQANVMTKGEVSLALSGTGKGWDLGIAFGKLQISR